MKKLILHSLFFLFILISVCLLTNLYINYDANPVYLPFAFLGFALGYSGGEIGILIGNIFTSGILYFILILPLLIMRVRSK